MARYRVEITLHEMNVSSEEERRRVGKPYGSALAIVGVGIEKTGRTTRVLWFGAEVMDRVNL